MIILHVKWIFILDDYKMGENRKVEFLNENFELTTGNYLLSRMVVSFIIHFYNYKTSNFIEILSKK